MDDTTEHGTSLWYKLFQLKQIEYKFNFELDTWERKSEVFIKLARRFVVLADNVGWHKDLRQLRLNRSADLSKLILPLAVVELNSTYS